MDKPKKNTLVVGVVFALTAVATITAFASWQGGQTDFVTGRQQDQIKQKFALAQPIVLPDYGDTLEQFCIDNQQGDMGGLREILEDHSRLAKLLGKAATVASKVKRISDASKPAKMMIGLLDPFAVDGDRVRLIESEESHELSLTRRDQWIAVSLTGGVSHLTIEAIHDADGNGVAAAIYTGQTGVLLPVLAEGEKIKVEVAR